MWQPDVTVAAICVDQDRYLMVEERSKSSNLIVFNQPAGHLEPGESIFDAVVRETLEETCCHFTPTALVGVYRLQKSAEKTYLRFTFCGDISPPDPNYQRDSDIIDCHWLSYAELSVHSQLRSELVLACVDDFRAEIRYPLELLREL